MPFFEDAEGKKYLIIMQIPLQKYAANREAYMSRLQKRYEFVQFNNNSDVFIVKRVEEAEFKDVEIPGQKMSLAVTSESNETTTQEQSQ